MPNTLHPENSIKKLPILPLRQLVLFPGTVLSVEVGRSSSLKLLEEAAQSRPPHVLVATQLDPQVDEPTADQLCQVAVEAELLKLIRAGNDRATAVLQGIKRHHFQVVQTQPYLEANVAEILDPNQNAVENEGLALVVKEAALKWLDSLPESNQPFKSVVEQIRDPGQLADILAVPLELPFPDRITLLSEPDAGKRLRTILDHLHRASEVLEVKKRIEEQVEGELSKQQREFILRQQMKVIQEKLGEAGEDTDLEGFRRRIDEANMPEEAKKAALKQLQKLRDTPQAAPDYAMQKTYLEWLCDLPWSERTDDQIRMEEARTILDADHYGLEKVKKRILEYIAIQKLAPHKKGTILCLVGPPGVGKTSLGKSIAKALGRKFARISLGGVRDESEIRGHRRTYIGALPGRFIQAMKRAQSKNPVILLDEIDKLSSDFRGDPSSALLEVLDPEQNATFSDHYIEIPFDLSEAIFITTANTLDTISDPLLDRMEVIPLVGYTLEEKKKIAQHHLLPKQLEEHGLSSKQVHFTDTGLEEIIEHYTKEAGVRNLEREIANVLRAIATEIVSKKPSFASKEPSAEVSLEEGSPLEIRADQVSSYLGPPRYLSEVAEQTEQPGVAAGLAWTPVGGDLLFVEVSIMPGKGQLVLTGKLGDVMKESAQAALSWTRSHGALLGIQPAFFEKMDVHVHVPQGAMPKDGPSAGVTILTALVSRITGNRVRADVAMTGETTLRGVVLPVGGIKEKVLAAYRAGLKRVILPERNAKDLVDIPQEIKSKLEIILVKRVEEVLEQALTHSFRHQIPSSKEDGELSMPLLEPSIPLPNVQTPVNRFPT